MVDVGALELVLSNDAAARRRAEDALHAASQQPGFCGWLLGLVGLRRCATSYLKWFWCTAWCWRENKEASYRVIEDIGEDGSGRFVPTLDLAERPHNLADEGPTSIAFLAKLNGPAADFAELCLRTADEMAPAELRLFLNDRAAIFLLHPGIGNQFRQAYPLLPGMFGT